MQNKPYSNAEIVDHLLRVLDLPSKNSLATELGVSRQSLQNFAANSKIDINNKVISALIEYYKEI